MVIESTYGDRRHAQDDPFETLAGILRRTLERDGILLIPSFAVGRAQALLYCLHQIFERGLAPRVPVFVNSPMATAATQIFRRSCEYHWLSEALCDSVFDVAEYTRTIEQSKRPSARRESAVIISASGMASGGRVLHHLRALAPVARNTILFPGFQAPGTRGESLVRGVETVKIHGAYVPVEAEVLQLDMFSAHADRAGLLGWLRACTRAPKRVYVTHGEAVAADTLRREIKDTLGFDAHVPEYLDSVELSA